MNVRPALIPERLRPAVLAPIYLLRLVVKILFWIAWASLLVVLVILAPIPILQDIISVKLRYKIVLAVVLLLLVFAPSARFLTWLQAEILDLLDRVERLAAGDILEAAALCYELSQRSTGFAVDYTLRKAHQSREATQQLAQKATEQSLQAWHATGAAAKRTSAATSAGTRRATQATVDRTRRVAQGTVDLADDVAEETTHLLHTAANFRLKNVKPKEAIKKTGKNMGSAAIKATVASKNAAVHTGQAVGRGAGTAGHFVYDTGLSMGHVAVDKSQLAAHQTFALVQTAEGMVLVVASETVRAAMDNLQKLLQLNPIVIFKRVVKIICKALLYLIIASPIVFWIVGKILWKLGIQPSALEALCLAWFLALFVCPTLLYIRYRALNQLNRVGGEIIHKAMERASGKVNEEAQMAAAQENV